MMVHYDLNGSSAFSQYLAGSRFDENLIISYHVPLKQVVDRIEFLEALSLGKKVIHLGFCDHLPIIEDKIAHGRWLHRRLAAAADRCIGIDVDQRAVEHITSRYKLTDVFSADLTRGPLLEVLKSDHWHYLIIGEVLEHIGNPVQFLSLIRERYYDCIDKVVITVPNAFRAGNFRGVLKGIESINSDHRFFFTPYTLTKVASEAGLEAEQLIMARFTELRGPKGWLKRVILNRVPLLSENLILVART
jgi:hypothetical protein